VNSGAQALAVVFVEEAHAVLYTYTVGLDRVPSSFGRPTLSRQEDDMSQATDAINEMQVGEERWLHPDNLSANHAEAFQGVVRELRDLHAQGVVEILSEHTEEGTIKTFIDQVHVRRLR